MNSLLTQDSPAFLLHAPQIIAKHAKCHSSASHLSLALLQLCSGCLQLLLITPEQAVLLSKATRLLQICQPCVGGQGDAGVLAQNVDVSIHNVLLCTHRQQFRALEGQMHAASFCKRNGMSGCLAQLSCNACVLIVTSAVSSSNRVSWCAAAIHNWTPCRPAQSCMLSMA